MKEINLQTKIQSSWCSGCSNFVILGAVQEVIKELIEKKKLTKKDVVIVTGIGCHGKMFDYLDLSGFYGLHGRVIPTAVGIKLGNSRLTVIGFGGDGDTFAEGIGHFLHACNMNPDIVMLVHDNQVFALTTGQMTPTTEKDYKGPSSPWGKVNEPINPLALALSAGASFVARSTALDKNHLKKIIKKAIFHKGFSFVDILQPCITFHNTIPYLTERIYDLEKEGYTPDNLKVAFQKAREWNYSLAKKARIPLGVFYQETRKTMDESILPTKGPWYTLERKVNYKKIISSFG